MVYKKWLPGLLLPLFFLALAILRQLLPPDSLPLPWEKGTAVKLSAASSRGDRLLPLPCPGHCRDPAARAG